MCGIAGLYNLGGQLVDPSIVERMSATITHRGPDDSGTMVDSTVGLACRRLAIIDLSTGHQPMTNEDGTLWLVFNGEIFNYRELRAELEAGGHRFRSQSDSEVILHAYEQFGTDCVQRFNGMFAIAIWDSRRKRLWLARDRLGVKPMHYFLMEGTFGFASEIKALLQCPGVGVRANAQAISQYLQYGYSIDDQTWFAGVKKLMPGWTAEVTVEGRLALRQYWDPIDRFREPESSNHYPDRIRSLLEDSVKLRMRSDVPVGAHLSGGLDSSSLVAIMAQQRPDPIHTFAGAFAEGVEYDERPFARLVSERYHTIHHEVVPTACEMKELMPLLTWHMDEPQAGPGVFPQFMVCRLAAENGIKVAIGGQGGDELFAGYPRYLRHYFGRHILRAGAPRGGGIQAIKEHATLARVGTLAMRHASRLIPAYHTDFVTHLHGYDAQIPVVLKDPLANELYNDLRLYLPALLQVEDRTSMAVSIESRTPLLDYRLVELAAGIPAYDQIQHAELKHLYRRAVQDLLPPPILARRDKMGFPTPIKAFFGGPLAGWTEEVLLSPAFLARRVLRPVYVKALLRGLHVGLDSSARLWYALNLALWFEAFDPELDW